MQIWLREHSFAIRNALAQIRRAPFLFFRQCVVAAIALLLPCMMATLLENAYTFFKKTPWPLEINVFLQPNLPRAEALALQAMMMETVVRPIPASSLQFIPREEGAQLFARTVNPALFDLLEQNPLPDAYVIRLDPWQTHLEDLETSVNALKKIRSVETVQVDLSGFKHTKELAWLLGSAGFVLIALALFTALNLIASTVRVQILALREQASVAYRLGATNAFNRRSFYCSGALFGLIAGIAAYLASFALFTFFNEQVNSLALSYSAAFYFAPLSAISTGVWLASCTLFSGASALWVRAPKK